MCVGSLADVTYLRYTVLMSSNKSETAVHCCDPAFSVLVVLVSRNTFHVVSALQSFALSCCLDLRICPVLKVSARLLRAKQRFNKERFQQAENLLSARCSTFVISKVLATRMRKLITARARKKKRTARMLANARKDHSIPLKVQ